MALLGWFGTVLGALAMALALSTVPATWEIHHHGAYLLLWAAVIVCGLIAVLAPAWQGWCWARFRLWVWSKARSASWFVVDMRVYPRSVTERTDIVFTTDQREHRHVMTPYRPTGLRIVEPFDARISSAPALVRRYGKTIFEIEQMVANGFVIGAQAPGITVKGFVSYADVPTTPKEPPAQPT